MNQQQLKGDCESWKQNWQHPKNAAVIRQQTCLKNQVTKLYLLPELPANTVAQSTHLFCFYSFFYSLKKSVWKEDKTVVSWNCCTCFASHGFSTWYIFHTLHITLLVFWSFIITPLSPSLVMAGVLWLAVNVSQRILLYTMIRST